MTRNLKTLTMLASAVLLAVTLTGCGEDAKTEPATTAAQAQTQDLLETIKSRGTITIAMEGTWSPWTYHDKDGKLTGFDVAIGERIAQKINVNAQVIDVNGKVIPGLYAAGEVTGGIHGSNRLGGNAIADIMTFGRTAGTNVVKMK